MQILKLREIKLMVQIFKAGEVAKAGVESKPAEPKVMSARGAAKPLDSVLQQVLHHPQPYLPRHLGSPGSTSSLPLIILGDLACVCMSRWESSLEPKDLKLFSPNRGSRPPPHWEPNQARQYHLQELFKLKSLYLWRF